MVQIKSEEDVKIHYLPGVLSGAGYDLSNVSYNVSISVKQGRKRRTIYADAVVYKDAAHQTALVVVETKPPVPALTDGDADQAFSYARLLTPIAPVVLLTNGSKSGTKAYDAFTKKLLTGGLPAASAVQAAVKKAHNAGGLAAEAKHEIFKVDNVQEYKRILRASHNSIRNNEGFDPTVAFDELSKVMFTKLFEERSGLGRFTVKKLDDMAANNINIIQQIFSETTQDAEYKGLFVPGDKINLSDRTIRELVAHLEDYDLSLTDFDVKGEAFEHFLGDTFTGGLGQYFTPRNVVDFMVDALGPKVGEKVVDPFCGTGGFLIKWHSHVAQSIDSMGVSAGMKAQYTDALNKSSLYGIDWNERTSLACRMNMTMHGEGESSRNIFKQSGFVDAMRDDAPAIGKNLFDVCLTNPPFGSSESDPKILEAHELGAGRRSIERAALALERSLALTKPGGWIGLIVMDGILANDSTKFVRDHVRKNAYVRGLISLNSETFEAYGGRANTTILFLEKKDVPRLDAGKYPTFMAMCRNSGYAANGEEMSGNELPAILESYLAWRKGRDPIAENTWVAEVTDRLDPSYYWRPALAAVSAGALDEALETTGSKLQNLVDEMGQIQTELKALKESMPQRKVSLNELLEEVSDSENLIPGTSYELMGVRWWGGGAFVREVKLGKDIKAKSLRKVLEGVLVYNRLFAFRASFAVVGTDCKDAYASAEFPMYQAREGIYNAMALKKYVVHALNSPRYLPRVDAESSGSTKTSRNRFRQPVFESFQIVIPTSPEDLDSIVALLDRADELRDRLASLASDAKQLRDLFSGVIL